LLVLPKLYRQIRIFKSAPSVGKKGFILQHRLLGMYFVTSAWYYLFDNMVPNALWLGCHVWNLKSYDCLNRIKPVFLLNELLDTFYIIWQNVYNNVKSQQDVYSFSFSFIYYPQLIHHYKIDPELEAIRGHNSAHSFATGPETADPFISPLLFTITPALSSKWMKTPSFLRNDFLWRMTIPGTTFLRSSGFPFFTEHMTISPAPAFGRRLRRPPILQTEMMCKFLAPELSAQLITAATGRPALTLCLIPDAAARPLCVFFSDIV